MVLSDIFSPPGPVGVGTRLRLSHRFPLPSYCGARRPRRAKPLPRRTLIRPCGPPSPCKGEGFWTLILPFPPLRGEGGGVSCRMRGNFSMQTAWQSEAPGVHPIGGPSSGQSPHRSKHPAGISHSAPLPLLPQMDPLRWAPFGSLFPLCLVVSRGLGVGKAGTQHEPNGVGRIGKRRHKGADRLFAVRRKERGAHFGSTTIPPSRLAFAYFRPSESRPPEAVLP